MRKHVLFFSIIAVLLISLSCNRNLDEVINTREITQIQDLNIPIGFNWENSKVIELVINLQSYKAYQPKSKISVFTGDPDKDGKLYCSGSIVSGDSYTTKLNLPPYIEEVFLVCEGPYGSVKKEKVAISAGLVNYTFSDVKKMPLTKGNQNYKNTTEGPDCTEGCDQYISGGGTVNINGGQTYCVLESFNGKINFQNWDGGGTLRVCGEATITNNQYLESNSHIVVTEGGILNTNKDIQLAGASITIYQNANVDIDDVELGNNAEFIIYEDAIVSLRKFDGWGTEGQLINYGSLEVEKNSTHQSPIENYGSMIYKKRVSIDGGSIYNAGELEIRDKLTCYGSGASIDNDNYMYVKKDFEYGSSTIFTNNGTATFNDAFKVYNSASLINNGVISTVDNCDINTNGDFTNNCQFTSAKNIDFSSGVKVTLNFGFLKAGLKINLWNNKSIDLFDNSMIIAEDMEMECDINGQGNLSSVIVNGDLNIWSNGDKFSGPIEVATPNGELNAGGDQNFTNGAFISPIDEAQNYIPITACNSEGFGTPTVVDMDFDGIIDDLDDYPEDPLRAFNSYFPDDAQSTALAFEDLWPSKGDYDFNDLVVAVFGNYVTNADDKLVDYKLNFVVRAVGASLDNGFGFQLETITPEMIESVTGSVLEQGYTIIADNGLEEDQSKAVVIVTESINDVIHRPGGSFFNTVPENPQGTADTIRIEISFTEPIDMALAEISEFNPFVIKNKDRSVEIHLPHFPPTDLMNTDLFGTYDDASNPVAGIYYVSTTNLPWGMFLVEPFSYPVEKSQVIDAYNYFGTWAESGGTLYEDWYLDFSGYRNSEDIY